MSDERDAGATAAGGGSARVERLRDAVAYHVARADPRRTLAAVVEILDIEPGDVVALAALSEQGDSEFHTAAFNVAAALQTLLAAARGASR